MAQASKTTELISIDGGVEYGPELPEAVAWHAITSINSTVSLLSGGSTSSNSYSSRTWYFNHETNVFSSGPSLLQGRRYHGSATVVDKVTKAKIPMVTGGYGIAYYLDTTELLFNGEWHAGKNQHTLDPRITFFKILIFLLNQDQHYQPLWLIMQWLKLEEIFTYLEDTEGSCLMVVEGNIRMRFTN